MIYGGDGNDVIDGDDTYGGTLDLTLHGSDSLYGEGGSDTIKGWRATPAHGGAGNDSLQGGAAATLTCSAKATVATASTISACTTPIPIRTASRRPRRLRRGRRAGSHARDPHRKRSDDPLDGCGPPDDRSGWFLGNPVEQFQLPDGTVLTAAQMEARIGATLDNTAPALTMPITDRRASEDSAFAFQIPVGTFADPDPGETLTYTATLAGGAALPPGSFSIRSPCVSGTPGNAKAGTLNLVVTATGNVGAAATDAFAIQVQKSMTRHVVHPAARSVGARGESLRVHDSGLDVRRYRRRKGPELCGDPRGGQPAAVVVTSIRTLTN